MQKGRSVSVQREGCQGEQTLKHVWCHQEEASLDTKHLCERLGAAEQACNPRDAWEAEMGSSWMLDDQSVSPISKA